VWTEDDWKNQSSWILGAKSYHPWYAVYAGLTSLTMTMTLVIEPGSLAALIRWKARAWKVGGHGEQLGPKMTDSQASDEASGIVVAGCYCS
jgi:hypothetical protein